MKPVPQDRLKEILIPIADQFRVETNTEDRSSSEYAVGQVNDGYENRTMAAYVDDLENPRSCLVLKTGRSWMHPAPVCIILIIWVKPDARTSPDAKDLVEDMLKTATAFAQLNECENLFGSSWVYLGSRDISPLWSSEGFDLQEKVFFKALST